ncbi:uncharacterized protein N7459_002633 [Penicillium hispanicum]|uniref:uncharacterized protein n=1 Tax=Penicillium hispanicum TaxID=1080232 RepID=UPI0025409DA4|nr:uncharacterized protein N7459_002633 [Penicillium hispanicum]KAJ5586868.1 hypothetical protein N7459_002633 [Penicillium hispanicum]
MLSELPSEIVYHIAIYLPTANAVTHLAETCHRLHKILSAHEWSIFRTFVQKNFSSIITPFYWKDAACALTSRSRALDRLGIIGRCVIPPQTVTRVGVHETSRRDNPTLGYRPCIDSYEIWNGESWADRREVLAWGAGHQIILRTKQFGTYAQEDWALFNDVDSPSSYDDICGLHLLKTEHDRGETDAEHLIFGRMRGDLVHLSLCTKNASYEYQQRFITYGQALDRTDLSDVSQSILTGHFENGSIAFYHTNTGDKEVAPFAWVRAATESLSRNRYSKLLSDSRVAVATGKTTNSLSISTLSPEDVFLEREIGVDSLDLEEQIGNPVHANVSAIAPLNTHRLAGSPGDVFLAAWGDRAIRLHDLRSPHAYETTYRDTTDMSLIYSVQPFGHDRFLAGASGNALVKIFDLRMSGAYSYNYLDAQIPHKAFPSSKQPKKNKHHHPRKDFSLFISAPLSTVAPRHLARARRGGTYRGPIYTMSTPSMSSPTVYTGIVDGVVRLDFASTDDLTGPAKDWYDYNLDLGVDKGQPSVSVEPDKVFRMAGYERPDPSDLTTTSKLRTQHGSWYPDPKHVNNEANTGWDRRWEPLEKPGAWRRRDG